MIRITPLVRLKINDLISVILIVLFVYAAVSKLIDYDQFAAQLGQSPMLSPYADILALLVPGVEIIISALLVLPGTRLLALYTSFGLMTMFTAYIVLASRFSDYVPCSCGGVIQDLTWTEHIFFNAVFIILSVMAILMFDGSQPHRQRT